MPGGGKGEDVGVEGCGGGVDDGGESGVEEVGGEGVSLIESARLVVEGGGAILEDDRGAGDGVVEVEIDEGLMIIWGGSGEAGEVG